MDDKTYLAALERELAMTIASGRKDDAKVVQAEVDRVRKELGLVVDEPKADKPKAPAKKAATKSKKAE